MYSNFCKRRNKLDYELHLSISFCKHLFLVQKYIFLFHAQYLL